MSVVIRLSRTGKANSPQYRILVADSRRWRDGKYLARVGWFNPCVTKMDARLKFDLSTVEDWMKKGARPTATVATLLKKFRAHVAKGSPAQ